jgi:hypothetical protein
MWLFAVLLDLGYFMIERKVKKENRSRLRNREEDQAKKES